MSDPQPIKYLDPYLFTEVGYLQELNRQFLHPLGLALEVTGWTEAGIDKFVENVLEKWGELEVTDENTAALIKDVLARLGIEAGSKSITGVWDAREDPEGWVFDWTEEDEERIGNARIKAANIAQAMNERTENRIRAVGHWVQPIPGFDD